MNTLVRLSSAQKTNWYPCRALAVALLALGCSTQMAVADESPDTEKTHVTRHTGAMKVLLITGGCCHDYDFQTKQMVNAAERHGVKVEWKIVNDGGRGTRAQIDLYQDPQWAKGFDVVIHNECFAETSDAEYIRKITKAHHNGANAVVIHCAMHTYRAAKIDDWRQFLGVTSRHHEHQSRYPVRVVAKDHPIMQGFPSDYVTPMDELYIVKHVWPNTKTLATSTSEKTEEPQPVFWVNQFGKARVFGTTYGHSNETFADKTFQDTIVRGMLWAAGRLGEQSAKPDKQTAVQ